MTKSHYCTAWNSQEGFVKVSYSGMVQATFIDRLK